MQFSLIVPWLGVQSIMFPAKEKVNLGETRVLLIRNTFPADCTDCDYFI